jgi:hypothetical protein
MPDRLRVADAARRQASWWLSSVLVVMGCGRPQPPPDGVGTVAPVYDARSGQMRALNYDGDRDGRTDAVGEVEGTRIVRVLVDDNQDGKPDRWEYYGPDQQIQKVGFSTAGDGRENAWSYPAADGSIARVETAQRSDGKVSRIEHFEHDQLVRAEEDADGDGRPDRWETYASGRLVSVAFDDDHRGRATRRITYRGNGASEVEVDRAGDGHWQAEGASR